MGAECCLLRRDTKTAMNMGKYVLSKDIMGLLVADRSIILEFWSYEVIKHWEAGTSMVVACLIRDRMLDFKTTGEWFDPRLYLTMALEKTREAGYKVTHDRYMREKDVQQYQGLLQRDYNQNYLRDPLEFFRKSGINKGAFVE